MPVDIEPAAPPQLENDLDLDVDTADMKTLLNPLIVSNIFSSLDAPTLKSVRLVCTAWADVGATFLGKQSVLTYSTPPNRGTCEYKDLTAFNHKLARNIKLEFSVGMICFHNVCTCPPTLPTNFALILPEISAKLETLEFFNVIAFEPVTEIWSTYNFSGLTQISITAEGRVLDNKAPLTEMAEFRPLPKLKVFSLKIYPTCENPSSRDAMATICQDLVSSAPNLEEVDLNTNFFLDLTECGKLKELRFKFSLRFEISKMMEMLESLPNSLESLTLHFGWDRDPIKLELHFPNLTHLRVISPDGYIFKNSLNATFLPKLTHFSISSIGTSFVCDVSKMVEHYHWPHVGITSLDMSCTFSPGINNEDGDAARRLVNLFPAVKELKLKLIIGFFNEGDHYILKLRERMQSYGDWELTSGQVDFEITTYSYPDRAFGPNVIIAVLRGMAGWRGLANTSLKFTGHRCSPALFRLSGEMRDALLSCRTIRSVDFTGFLMDDETKSNFQTFIRQHDLPISITEDENVTIAIGPSQSSMSFGSVEVFD